MRLSYMGEGAIFQLILRFFLFAGLEGGAITHFSLGLEFKKVFLNTNYSLSSHRTSQLQVSLTSSPSSLNSSRLSSSKLSRLNFNPCTLESKYSIVLKRDHRNLSLYRIAYLFMRYTPTAATGRSRFQPPWTSVDCPSPRTPSILSTTSHRSSGGHCCVMYLISQCSQQLGRSVRFTMSVICAGRMSYSSFVMEGVLCRRIRRRRRCHHRFLWFLGSPFKYKRQQQRERIWYQNRYYSRINIIQQPSQYYHLLLQHCNYRVRSHAQSYNPNNFIMASVAQPCPAQIKLYHNMSSFIAKHKIQLLHFWKTSRLCLTTQQFLQLLLSIGYEYTMEQIEQLSQAQVQFFNIESVIKNVDVWRNTEGSVSDFISKQVQHEEEQQRLRSRKRNKDSKLDTLSSFGASQGGRSRATQRLWKKEVSLNETLIRTKNESDYELTIKVGEANDICKKLNNDRSFLIQPAGSKVKLIQSNPKSGKQQQIKPKQFQRVYQKLKEQSLAKGMEFEGTIQQDLKKVLVQVMYLSSELEQQIRLIEQKGITH